MAGSAPLRTAVVRQQLFFPDRRLIQFDCGKLQVCALLTFLAARRAHGRRTCSGAARCDAASCCTADALLLTR